MTYEEYAKIRDSRGVKDGTVAAATGIGRSTFTDWKVGRSSPKQEKLLKIADYLGITINELFPNGDYKEIPILDGIKPAEQKGKEDRILLEKIHSLNDTNYSILTTMLDTLLKAQESD